MCVSAAHAPVAPEDALDVRFPPAMALVGDGLAVLWRDRDRALRLQRYAADLRPSTEPRTLAQPVDVFAFAPAAAGAVAVWVEEEREVVLGRFGSSLEAQNVPRVLAAANGPVTAVAVQATATGLLVAWSTAAGVYRVATTATGVPRAAPAPLLGGFVAGALSFDGAEPAGLRAEAAPRGADAWVFTLRGDGAEEGRARWPSSVSGPVRVDGQSMGGQVTAQGAPALLRAPVEAPPTLLADPSVAPRARIDGLAADGDLCVATVVDVASGRASLARLLADGSAAWLGPLRGLLSGPTTMAARAPGTVWMLSREPSHTGPHDVVTRYACAVP